jgi:hypothetical protein
MNLWLIQMGAFKSIKLKYLLPGTCFDGSELFNS